MDQYDPDARFPPIPLALVEELERRFPDKCPELDTPEREVWAHVGRVQVVRFLRQMYEFQHESQ